MPPKASGTGSWPPRRSARFTARKSVPCLSPSSSAEIAAAAGDVVTPPPSSVILEPIRQGNQLEKSPGEFSQIPQAFLAPCKNSETLGTDLIKSVPIEKEEAQNLGESGNCAKEELVLCCDPVEKSETSTQIVGGQVSGTGEVVGAGKSTRKVIRRTVRVVKRVIKKKVPKKGSVNGLGSQSLVESAENAVALAGVNDSEVVNDVAEKPDELIGSVEISNVVDEDTNEHLAGVDNVIERPVLAGEVAKELNVREELEDVVNLDDGTFVSEANAGESRGDKSGIGSLEKEISQVCNGAGVLGGNELNGIERLDIETLKVEIGSCGVGQVAGENSDDQIGVEMVSEKGDEVMAEVYMKDANMGFSDRGEEKKVQVSVKSMPESERAKVIVESVTDDVLEDSDKNQNMHTSDKQAVQSLGSAEEKHVVLVEEKGGSHGKPESGNDLLDNPSVCSSEGLLLSGEMEALERRKRRKTEIFVGGLDKDVKEDDIRKAFQDDGAILDVKLVMNNKTGKNKGFAFVKFCTASDANNALMKYSKAEICGKQCVVTPVEGNDTVFLGNIDRSWKIEDVKQLLEKAGIVNVDKVTLKADPKNIERNRGFAFVEFETNRDAKNAYNRMQKKSTFGRNSQIRVDWAQPLIEPAEEEILKVKSVYAEYLPSSWNEDKVKEYFKTFGELENVVLAKDLPGSRRNDFAFINYTTREAALACIEAVSKQSFEENGTKVKVTVSLAKPITMRKQTKHASCPTTKQLPKETPKVSQASIRSHEPRNIGKPAWSTYDRANVDTRSSTNDELVHILRQQAAANHVPPRPSFVGAGTTMPGSQFHLPGGKRPYPFAGHDPLYLEPRGLPRLRVGSSSSFSGSSSFSHGGGAASLLYHQPLPDFAYESPQGRNSYPGGFESRERAPYSGNNSTYRRY